MREVVRGDKHNLRKSANHTAQISIIHSAHCTDLCFAIYLQIFSGCACHLEQLHAQSPFLFHIVFSINLIPFFDICSVLAVPSLGLFGNVLLYFFTWAFARSQQFAVCGFGSWALVFHCGLPRQISRLPPTPSQTEVCSTMRESITCHKTVVFLQTNALREEARRTNLPLLAIGCRAGCSGERRTSSFNGIERSLSRAVVMKTKSLSVSATTFPTALSLKSRTMGESISTIQRSPRLSTSYKFTAPRYRLLSMALQTVQVSVEPRLSTTLIDRSVVP